jgi:hypothetical protein
MSAPDKPYACLLFFSEYLAKVERTPPARKIVKLGEDVYLAPGDYNSVFVVFNDYILAVALSGCFGARRCSGLQAPPPLAALWSLVSPCCGAWPT